MKNISVLFYLIIFLLSSSSVRAEKDGSTFVCGGFVKDAVTKQGIAGVDIDHIVGSPALGGQDRRKITPSNNHYEFRTLGFGPAATSQNRTYQLIFNKEGYEKKIIIYSDDPSLVTEIGAEIIKVNPEKNEDLCTGDILLKKATADSKPPAGKYIENNGGCLPVGDKSEEDIKKSFPNNPTIYPSVDECIKNSKTRNAENPEGKYSYQENTDDCIPDPTAKETLEQCKKHIRGYVTKYLKCTEGVDCTHTSDITCDPLTGKPDKTPDSNHKGAFTAIGCIPTDTKSFVEYSLKFIIGLSGGIALLLMAFSAFQMITSSGNAEVLKKANDQFYNAIIGLLFIIFSVMLLQIIGVNLLNIPGFS